MVAVYVKKQICLYCVDEKRVRVTVLVRNASARCCAPIGPIWFSARSSVVSVCVKKQICLYRVDEKRVRVTVLVRNASARCCAPMGPF